MWPLSAPGCCRICTFERIARFPFLLSGISCLFFDKQQQEGDAREITIREMGTDRQRKVRSQKQTGSITVHGPAPLPPPGLRGAPRSTFPLTGEMFFWRFEMFKLDHVWNYCSNVERLSQKPVKDGKVDYLMSVYCDVSSVVGYCACNMSVTSACICCPALWCHKSMWGLCIVTSMTQCKQCQLCRCTYSALQYVTLSPCVALWVT